MKTGTRRKAIDRDAPTVLAPTSDEQSPLLPQVDAALEQLVGRGLVSSIEVVDLLLDLRSRIVLEHALRPTTDTTPTTERN
jgi:hypothetical protein